MGDAAVISRALAARALPLCQTLLPAGVREGAEWRVGSLAGEKGKSLAVHLYGAKAGIFCDFSSGVRGDALSLVAEARFGGDLAAALKWARTWLGTAPAPEGQEQERERRSPPDDLAKIRRAMRIFLDCTPQIAGTPADLYLSGRGIHLAQLGRQPRSLRFHPALFNGEARASFPALVAAVVDQAGKITACHRTWLGQDDMGRWRKAPLAVPKASLGKVAGGSIRIWRGASGRPLAEAKDGEMLVIAEGIETALSVAVACPELRVLAAVSLPNLARINLPRAIGTIVIAADNDKPGGQAEAALNHAVAMFLGQGRKVRIARSPIGSDMNDCLVA